MDGSHYEAFVSDQLSEPSDSNVSPRSAATLEAWGGCECSVNRIGDRFLDQVRATGHHDRPDDYERIADLGLDAIRFPVLWERVASDGGKARDWEWSDVRLAELRAGAIRPIVGLVHHGSGPRHTSLIDDGFAAGLAGYAAEVVSRYPWVTDWTPINEPLTTARFALLYGHWYPHQRDEALFWRALLNQIDATRLAMREIRKVQPAARLVQTEDLGRTYATGVLLEQAAFDNERRWMTWDLLAGLVGPDHPLWSRLCAFGFETRLRSIQDDPCPPDIVGIDHYLTSDRFLDHRTWRYPGVQHGGNGKQIYCDTEAVRVLTPPPAGLEGAIGEAWARYRRPIAITEVHNGCTREEQIRWLSEAWAIARRVRAEGIDVRAITAWALFGSQGWNTLLTADGRYESGSFDASVHPPRQTALAEAVRMRGRTGDHGGPGWWRRPIRLLHRAIPRPAPMAQHRIAPPAVGEQRVLICGATGTLGRAMAAECQLRGLEHVVTTRSMLDLEDVDSVARALDIYRPWAVVNAAGWVRVDDAEHDHAGCHAANASGAVALGAACAEREIATLMFSSDLVFNGRTTTPYREGDAPDPINIYGRSKTEMESGLADLQGNHLVVRTAAFFSPFDDHNFAAHCLTSLAQGAVFKASNDHVVSPTYVPHLCRTALDLLTDRESGVWHLTSGEAVSWFAFAKRLARAGGFDPCKVVQADSADLGWKVPRPRFVPLASDRGSALPSLDAAIDQFFGSWR
jgi:dTDP-4-dehydrorhamnose reductase